MSNTEKHRGWLLVYELQYWIILVMAVVGSLTTDPIPIGFIGVSLAFWSIPIFSLYRSTNAVRRGHIVWCWLLAVVAVYMAIQNFTNEPPNLQSPYDQGAVMASLIWIALWASWALYWQKSERVKRAYPVAEQKEDE